jgi:hypothetical protein
VIEPGDQLPNLSLKVKNAAGALDDGGAVALAITLPDQSVVSSPGSLNIAHPSTGLYSSTYVATQAGLYSIVWTVTGANAGTFTDSVYVEGTTAMVSLSDVKNHLRIFQSKDDEVLRSIALVASNACESAEGTNRRWRRRVITNEVHRAAPAIQLFERPVLAITSVTAGNTLLSSDDYDVNLATGYLYDASGFFTTDRAFGMSVSYIAGATQIPPLVREGVLEMCRHLYGQFQGGARVPGQSEPEYATSLGYLIPSRVAFAWRPYAYAG